MALQHKMVLAAAVLLIGAARGAGVGAKGPSVSSASKVLQMLSSMAAKAKEEKQAEEVAFAKFSTWCTEESASLKSEIAKSAQEIEGLTADIGKLESDIKGLGESIAGLESELESFHAEQKASTEQREKDHAEFLTESQDYSESVDALERAIVALSKEDYDRPAAAAALLQVDQPNMPEKARSILTAFAGMDMGEESLEAPKANAYEFQSSGVVDMLKKLRDEFRTKLGESQKGEQNSLHAYNMIIEDLTHSIATAEKTIAEQTEQKGRKQEKAALDEKELGATEATKASDETLLSEMSTECSEKKYSFEEKQELRAEEIEAIEKAVEILSSPEVVAKVDKYMSLSQGRTSATSLVQRKSAAEDQSTGVHKRVRNFLAAEGKRLHSQRLGLLAEKMEADPFAKVKKLIDSMITRLLNEANEDADHEGFCDTEMGKSKTTRTKLGEDIDALSAAVEEGKATITQLTQELAVLEKDLADLAKALTEATELRNSEKATNKATIQDAKDSQATVQAAIAVLKEFYSKAGTATAFVQEPVKMGSDLWKSMGDTELHGTVDKGHKEGMQTFGDAYLGQQKEAGGVLALLDVIMSDFATLEADTAAAESESAKAFEEFSAESKKSKATKTKQVDMVTADKTAAEARLATDTADLKATQDELLAAERYYEKLVPQCIDQGMTFEERTAARQAEITSLKEALQILDSEDIETSA